MSCWKKTFLTCMNRSIIILSAVLALSSCTHSTESRVRRYISSSWERSVRFNPQGDSTLIGLPRPFTVPSPLGMFEEMYYWDTFFTNEGLIADGNIQLAKDNTDNILYLVEKYGFMPNGNRTWYLNRSQPPFLSLMVASVYKQTADRQWLHQAYGTLEKEYRFWMETHSCPEGLNRYSGDMAPRWLLDEFVVTGAARLGTDYHPEALSRDEADRIARNFVAEAESGWDFNPRFDRRCEEFCPVDLNSLMYSFEKNMAYFASETGLDETVSGRWEALASSRKEKMMEKMYDSGKKQFFDYDFINDTRSDVISAAVFYPLYTGLLDAEYAGELVKSALSSLEFKYGISVCEDKPYPYEYQWSYPNIWPPTTFIAVFGLDNYGFEKDARRIAGKYLRLVEKSWKQTGTIWEKYDVNLGATSTSKEYDTPEMLGWSAATYVCLSDYLKR